MNGFRLLKKQEIKELRVTGFLYEHIKTGAQVLYMDNGDEEKVFSIAFKTPPADDSGIAHVTEHSVLCGSRKYPLREPFVELMKGSVNTFLNAMTYTDWTVYPVASKNEKDFKNLTDVYLDAVFFPKLKENPHILKQEGWHYELDKERLFINGIVYNEMKGMFSSPSMTGWLEFYRNLYPDSIYRFMSGGVPESIPQLTQETFVAFHERYYHPSNSYVLLAGNLEIQGFLQYLDQEYFSKFEKKERKRMPVSQQDFAGAREVVREYPIGKGEPVDGKTYFYYGVSLPGIQDRELILGIEILQSILSDFPASPLKRALVDGKIVADLTGEIDDSISLPNVVFTGIGGDSKNQAQFKQLVEATLKGLSEKGLDRDLVKAAINKLEFKLRELDSNRTPRGIVYHLMNLSNWINEDDAFKGLMFARILNEIKEKVDKGYFEKLIKNHLLGNSQTLFLTLVPRPGLEEKMQQDFEQKMKKELAVFSKSERQKISEEEKQLKKLQATPDSPKALASLPILKLDDLRKEGENIPFEKIQDKETTYLWHSMNTNGIVYLRLNFDASGLKEHEIPYLKLLSQVLGKISTEKYNYKDLANKIYGVTGGIAFSTMVAMQPMAINKYRPYLVLSGKVLAAQQDELYSLVSEILLHSRYDEKERLRELIGQLRASLEASVAENGFEYAVLSAGQAWGGGKAYEEKLGGETFFKFIHQLDENFEQQFNDLKDTLARLGRELFVRSGLVAALALDVDLLSAASPRVKDCVNMLPAGEALATPPVFATQIKRKAIVIGGKVQYVVKGIDLSTLGLTSFPGQLKVLENILSGSYLWNTIRVLGGAYGGFFRVNPNGFLYIGSYRDPNLAESLKVYDEISDYLKKLSFEERELTKNIIGTIGGLDIPSLPKGKLDFSVNTYLMGITPELRQKVRQEVFATTLEELKKYAVLFDKIANVKNYTVSGSEEKILGSKELFEQVVKIWE